jgi:hypothetical protein
MGEIGLGSLLPFAAQRRPLIRDSLNVGSRNCHTATSRLQRMAAFRPSCRVPLPAQTGPSWTAQRTAAVSPFRRMLRDAQKSVNGCEAKTFNNRLSIERGFW